MTILFKNKSAEKQFSSKNKKTWRYPEKVKKELQAMENFIIQASTLSDIVNFRPYHFHLLEGDRKSEWALYLKNTGYRVTLFPCDEAGTPITRGDIIAQCKTIKIVMVTEVSNHYE